MKRKPCNIVREWAMPNRYTFEIPPIKELLFRYLNPKMVVVDPFAANSAWGTWTNDLNPDTTAGYHMEASDFLDEMLRKNVLADVVIFDPPYSPRQIKECYNSVGLNPTMEQTQSARVYREVKTRLNHLLKVGGYAICCGWNSVGMGFKAGYELIELLLVCHGPGHNDTIVTVERKILSSLDV
jgi:hypothetical protein